MGIVLWDVDGTLVDSAQLHKDKIFAIASAPAATLLANLDSHDYVPLMFMPPNSQRVVRVRQDRVSCHTQKARVISLLHEQPSTVFFYFEQLKERCHFKRGSYKLIHQEPWESFEYLASGDKDLESVLFFPFAQLNVAYNGCELVETPSLPSGSAEAILFAHKSLLADKRRALAVCAAIRSGWVSLLESQVRREQAVESFVSEASFVTNLRRITGLSEAVI